jgi:hypothetical protein
VRCCVRTYPGASRSTPRRHQWREHEERWTGEVIQPVLAMPLDAAVKTWLLPPPNAIRVALGDAGADSLTQGADTVLDARGLHTVIVQAAKKPHAVVAARLTRAGFALLAERAAGGDTCSRWARAPRRSSLSGAS